MLVQSQRRWTNIELTLVDRFVMTGSVRYAAQDRLSVQPGKDICQGSHILMSGDRCRTTLSVL